jgi:hypothetical protein
MTVSTDYNHMAILHHLKKHFCHGCLWTSKLFWMVSRPNFFIQQSALWATQLVNMKIFHIRYRCLHVSSNTTQWW